MSGVITLTTGLKDITRLTTDDVRVWDWAWGLQHQGRFSGSTPIMWSVLSHTGLVYELGMRDTNGQMSIVDQVALLLHDASEAYCVDVPRPIKRLPEATFFVDIENSLQRTIFARFGLDWDEIDWDLVNRYDYQALYLEFQRFFPHFARDNHAPPAQYAMDESKVVFKQGKPQQYADHLRHLTVNLAEVVNIPEINTLFECPAHLTPYLLDGDIHVVHPNTQGVTEAIVDGDDSILSRTL